MIFSALLRDILKPWKMRLPFVEVNTSIKHHLLIKMTEKKL